MSTEEDKALKQLRKIFFAESLDKEEQFEKELAELRFRTSDKEAKIEAYYPIITDLLERKIIDSEDEIAKVLSPLMGKAIKKQVAESKDDIIEALYPIMGETIKRSVAESVKEVYTSINLRIDNALRRGIFSKQIKSKISGVSATDLILQDSFPFRIKEIFLIHEESGILISHVSSEDHNTSADGDIISGMLTAIKDFVSDSFKSDSGTQNLYEIQYGNSRIILERGLYSYLAIVTSGQEPIAFHSDLSDLSADIYKEFHKELGEFDGEISELRNVNKTLLEFIKRFKKVKRVEHVEKPKPILLYLLFGILGLALLIWGAFTIPNYLSQKSMDELIISKLGTIDDVDINDINISHENDEVILTGLVNSYNTKSIVDSTIKTIPEVTLFSNELGVIFKSVPEQEIISNVDEIINQLSTDQITYHVSGDKIEIDGEISSDERRHQLAYRVSNISGIRIVVNNIKVTGDQKLTIQEIIENTKLFYEFGKSELSDSNIIELNSIVTYLKQYSQLELEIKGYSEGELTKVNWAEANERATIVFDYLVKKSISPQRLSKGVFVFENDNIEDSKSRRVEFRIIN